MEEKMNHDETVMDFLILRHNKIVTVDPESTVFEALAQLEELKVGAALISEEGKILGTFSATEAAQKLGHHRAEIASLKVRDVGTPDFVRLAYNSSVHWALEVMNHYELESIIVEKDHEPVGVISRDEFTRYLLNHYRVFSESLLSYIYGPQAKADRSDRYGA